MEELTRRFRALAIVLACATCAPHVVLAAPTDAQMNEARTRYERGLKLYNEGANDAALVEMQRAYELAPSFKILYNLGLIHRQLNDYAAALKAFRRYLHDGGPKVPKDKRSEVAGIISELEKRVATITVEVDVAGAEVSVDDAMVGTSPLSEPILVNAGKRRIAAKLPGKPAAVRAITVAGMDTQTVKLELGEPTKSPPPVVATPSEPTTKQPEPQPKPSAPPEPHGVPWVAWGITGGLAAVTIASGVVAFASSRDLADKRDTSGTPREDLDSASKRTKTWSLVTDIGMAATVAMAGVSLYLTLKRPSAADTSTVHATLGPTGLALFGSF